MQMGTQWALGALEAHKSAAWCKPSRPILADLRQYKYNYTYIYIYICIYVTCLSLSLSICIYIYIYISIGSVGVIRGRGRLVTTSVRRLSRWRAPQCLWEWADSREVIDCPLRGNCTPTLYTWKAAVSRQWYLGPVPSPIARAVCLSHRSWAVSSMRGESEAGLRVLASAALLSEPAGAGRSRPFEAAVVAPALPLLLLLLSLFVNNCY